ncbi:hypothetical protein OHS33_36285 [Streptomyces sp. NBC_00536]|uniref:hypothetical protein n=1 Tax=Streptomyces sp. NBC_00536 TaxID=2975769 RepID=UPI002E803CAC|nr:hypothetical protein [Streptomyces sp. NBC_00536]WUC83356.1 hypothetical protein OHS33_36285 [Streptomyces sp. NBC_00536]
MQLAYTHGVVNTLWEFDEAKERIERHMDRLMELGDVICRHRLHESVGLCLLHRHFQLTDGERLVGSYREGSYVVGAARREDWTGVVPSVWRAETLSGGDTSWGDASWGYRPLEFVDTAGEGDRLGRRAERAMANPAFLDDLARRLHELGLADTVGLAALERLPGDLRETETVYETSSDRRRTSVRTPVGKESVPLDEITVTLWAFQAEPVA